jgi:N-acetylglucosamine malate deacetylase 1
MNATACDLLCVCPHTDDAEIALGGTLRLLADRGRRVWICDLTRGELGTNADPETRWREAQAAGEALGLAGRVQLALPDGFLDPASREQALALIHVLRRLRPSWAVSAPAARRHPDHLAIPALLRRAAFLSRLHRLVAEEPPARWWPAAPAAGPAPVWTPAQVGDTCPEDGRPDLLVDVTAAWPAKSAALACYASQFRREAGRAATHINDPSFLAGVEATGRRWGRRAGVEFAEALRLDMRPVVDDLPDGRWA